MVNPKRNFGFVDRPYNLYFARGHPSEQVPRFACALDKVIQCFDSTERTSIAGWVILYTYNATRGQAFVLAHCTLQRSTTLHESRLYAYRF